MYVKVIVAVGRVNRVSLVIGKEHSMLCVVHAGINRGLWVSVWNRKVTNMKNFANEEPRRSHLKWKI